MANKVNPYGVGFTNYNHKDDKNSFKWLGAIVSIKIGEKVFVGEVNEVDEYDGLYLKADFKDANRIITVYAPYKEFKKIK